MTGRMRKFGQRDYHLLPWIRGSGIKLAGQRRAAEADKYVLLYFIAFHRLKFLGLAKNRKTDYKVNALDNCAAPCPLPFQFHL